MHEYLLQAGRGGAGWRDAASVHARQRADGPERCPKPVRATTSHRTGLRGLHFDRTHTMGEAAGTSLSVLVWVIVGGAWQKISEGVGVGRTVTRHPDPHLPAIRCRAPPARRESHGAGATYIAIYL